MELNFHVLQSPGFLDPYLLYEILKSSERNCERDLLCCAIQEKSKRNEQNYSFSLELKLRAKKRKIKLLLR